MKKRLKKRGISPVIATTLLIAIVVVIALILFLWFRNVVGDYGEKFGKNIELVCEDVVLGADYSGGYLYLSNDGNVPVFKVNLKIEEAGGYSLVDLANLVGSDSWPKTGLKQGEVYSGYIGDEIGNPDEIKVIPVLLGLSSEGGKKTYTCDESYGYSVY